MLVLTNVFIWLLILNYYDVYIRKKYDDKIYSDESSTLENVITQNCFHHYIVIGHCPLFVIFRPVNA